MSELDGMIQALADEEQRLQFDEFTSETAWAIGTGLVEKARAGNKAVAIDITRNGHQLFHYAFEGTTPDNDQWIIRKNRVVNRFSKSSMHYCLWLRRDGRSIEDKSHVSHFDYAPNGGAFPIRVRNVGVVGTITVSGLSQEEDHALVVAAIEAYLNR